MLDEVEDSIKVIVVGDGNVGKTSMLRRFCKGDFVEEYKKTIGAEFMEKDVYVQSTGNTVKLMLWDTAGQEIFNALTSSYYRGAGCCVLAFSSVDRDSFMNVRKWKDKVEAQCGTITMVLCQTKCDLAADSVIQPGEAEALAAELRMTYFKISTKRSEGVTELFEFAAQQTIVQAEMRQKEQAAVAEKKPKKKAAAANNAITGAPIAKANEEEDDDDDAPPPPTKVNMAMMSPVETKPKKKERSWCTML